MGEILMLGWIAVLLVLIREDVRRLLKAVALSADLHAEHKHLRSEVERLRALLKQEEGNG